MSTPAILRHRRDTAANWTANNPVLEAGQIGYETDTRRFKFGNGSTAWTSLAYGVGALADGDVTYPKIQDTTAGSVLLGRGSSGAGDVQEITLGAGLAMTGTELSTTGGGGGGAPDNADYLVKTANAGLSAERVVTDSTSISANWSTAGQVAFQRAALTGDVTATANSNATTIANAAVSYAKIQNVSATDKVLGRSTAGAGSIEEITCTAAGRALLDDADASAQRTTLGLGTLATQSGTFSGTSSGTNTGDQTISLTGDVTGSGTGSFAATIANGAVSTAKLGGDITTAGKALLDDADASAQRTTLGLGTLATQSGTFSGTSSGTNTGDQTITLTGDVTGSGTGSFAATIANQAVTNAKLANVSTSTIKGRVTAGTGDPEDLTGTQATTLLDAFTSSLKGLAPASGGGTSNFLRADGTWAAPAGGGGTSAQVDTYTTTGTVHTWTKPSGAKAVQIIAHGAGGGGGGGGSSTTANFRTGGGGGGGGACGNVLYEANRIPSSLYVIVGAAGTGGASDAAGTAGGNSTVATNNTNPPTSGTLAVGGGGGGGSKGGLLTQVGGGGGGGTNGAGATGSNSATVSGGVPAVAYTNAAVGGQGGGGGYSTNNGGGRAEWGGGGGGNCRQENDVRYPGAGSLYGGGGGGVGVGLGTTGSATGGSAGGPSGVYYGAFQYGSGNVAPGGLPATTAAAGADGLAAGTSYPAGGGGGGGYANNSGTAYAGGAGGFPSGGGGGGGASGVASSGGVGGVGGAGRVVIITYF